ncbi:MAG: dipeptide epimerase [Maricaulaceae bacterium]|jgi:L-alanine-DL-glutamate epimerase-like enolase superfamily enzyme
MSRQVSAHIEEWPFTRPVRITGHVFDGCTVLVVEIKDGEAVGRGEASSVYYFDDTPRRALDQVEALFSDIENGLDRATLQTLLPAGGARNAVDCALWDLECKLAARTIWELVDLRPRPQLTAMTIGLRPTPQDVADAARALAGAPLLKVKLDGEAPIDRIRAVHAARPDARIIIDANQGFSPSKLEECLPAFKACGVEMVEQPLPRGADQVLERLSPCLPLCADESCIDRSDLATVARRYQMINIKLDKTGGLTEALALAHQAREAGLQVMVGNMGGTSLAMAPGFVLAQLCNLVDLDGPIGLKTDRIETMSYHGSMISEPPAPFWG